jgi:hypothetical protein
MADPITYQFAAPTDLNNIPSVANHAAEAMRASQKAPPPDLFPLVMAGILLFILKG